MLPLHDLAEVAAALAREELFTLTIVDRRHHFLVESRFDGTGPLKFVYWARADKYGMLFSCAGGELAAIDELPDLRQFWCALRNCFVYSLCLDADMFDDEDLAGLRAVREAYVVDQAELRYDQNKILASIFTSNIWICPVMGGGRL